MKLIEKLVAISDGAKELKKSGYNDFGKYNYAKEEDILNVLKPLLKQHSVFISHSIKEVKHTSYESMGKNNQLKRELFCEVLIEYVLHDGETEEKLILNGAGTGMDVGDKALYKALTGAHKYFLSKNFNISTDDDPENEEKEDTFNKYQPSSLSDSVEHLEYDPKAVFPFGKQKGTLLSSMALDELERAVDWIKDKQAKGEKISQSWLDFCGQVALIKQQKGKLLSQAMHMPAQDEDIGF